MQLSFNIEHYYACSPYHHCSRDWQQWANAPDKYLSNRQATMPTLDFIPAMQRRRLSQGAKLMFAALHALHSPTNTPVIFASHDGESNRSFALWLQLLQEGYMSPMSFGLSVHNALAGAWSLFTDNTAEINAISAPDTLLETALLEGFLLLKDGADNVNIVIVEDPLSQEYSVAHASRAPFPYALALSITAGEDYLLSHESQFAAKHHYWSPLDFLQHLHQGHQHWQQASINGTWTWQVTSSASV